MRDHASRSIASDRPQRLNLVAVNVSREGAHELLRSDGVLRHGHVIDLTAVEPAPGDVYASRSVEPGTA
jgi:hypothetical protein